VINTFHPRVLERCQTLLPKGSLRARFASGAFWSLAGAVIARGLNFIAFIIAARLLRETGFGELGMIQSTVGMFGAFAGFGLGLTATRYLAEFREKDPAKAGRILALSSLVAFFSGSIISLILIFFASPLATKTIAAPHLDKLLRIGAGLLFFGALNGAQTGALAGFEAFKTLARVNVLAGILSFPVMILGVWFWGLEGAVWGLTVSMGVNWLLNYLALKMECSKASVPYVFAGCWVEWPVLWKFSLPAFLSNVMVGPVIWAANSILVNQPDGYLELGLLSAANQVRYLILFVPMVAFRALLPILSSELNKDERFEVSSKIHILNVYSTWYLATAAAACLLYFIEPILSLYGKGFLSGNLALVLILCSIPILSYKHGIARLVQAKSLMWYGFASNLLWSGLLLSGTVWLAKYGAAGLGGAYLLAYFFNSIIVVPIYFRKLKMNRFINMDIQLGILLSITLIPGVLINIFSFPISIKFGMMILSFFILVYAGRKISFWFVRNDKR